MHVCMYVRMHVCMHGCRYASMYACMHVCMYVCTHACMHVRSPLAQVARAQALSRTAALGRVRLQVFVLGPPSPPLRLSLSAPRPLLLRGPGPRPRALCPRRLCYQLPPRLSPAGTRCPQFLFAVFFCVWFCFVCCLQSGPQAISRHPCIQLTASDIHALNFHRQLTLYTSNCSTLVTWASPPAIGH